MESQKTLNSNRHNPGKLLPLVRNENPLNSSIEGNGHKHVLRNTERLIVEYIGNQFNLRDNVMLLQSGSTNWAEKYSKLTSDVDLLIIGTKSGQAKRLDMQVLERFARAVKRGIEHYSNEGTFIVSFATFTTETYIQDLAAHEISNKIGMKHTKIEVVPLHTLLYPTIDALIKWEGHRIAKSITTNSRSIFGSDSDARALAKRMSRNGTEHNGKMNEDQLLMETLIARSFTVLRSNVHLALSTLAKESIRKMKYVSQLATNQFLNVELGINLPNWTTLDGYTRHLPEEYARLSSRINGLHVSPLSATMDDLVELHLDTAEIVNSLLRV
jgi:hypothetical protein